LIEVLVALTILSVSLGVLLAVFTQGLDRARESANEAAARVLAQSLLAQAKTSANISIGDAGGRINGVFWHLRVLPFGSAASLVAWQTGVSEISARVSWRGDGGMRSITLSTLRYVGKPSTASAANSDSDSE
jgi:general secretion pathway protein I